MKRSLLCLLGGLTLGVGLFTACSAEVPGSAPEPASFEQNGEAVRFVRSLRENISNGQRPPTPDVQRLKSLALQYPGESFIEEIHLSLLQGLGDWEGISTYFEAKPELDEEERFTLTRSYLRQADYPRARAAIKAFAATHLDSLEAQLLLARSNYFLGDFDEAAAVYDKVWGEVLSGGQTTDIAYRAMIEFESGNAPQALGWLESALKADPNSVPVLNSLSRVLASQGRLEEAQVHSATVARLQLAHTRDTADKERRASRIFALNKALGVGDVAGCEEMVFRFLPDANDSFAEELSQFLEKIYRMTGREAELPATLKRARETRRDR